MRRDQVRGLVDQAARLIEGSPDHRSVADLQAALAALPPRDLVRFDGMSRSWYSGLSSKAIARLRWPMSRGARKQLWEVVALLSGDGHERERAVREAGLTPLSARLLTIRATDWVGPVRAAALDRLDECPLPLLVEALPLADQLAIESIRGDELHLLLDRRLDEESLRQAGRAKNALVRRAAWRRLTARGVASAEDLMQAARDVDVLVRMRAASAIEGLEPDQREMVAQILVDDPVGAVATPALGVLVALNGQVAIQRALIGRSAGVVVLPATGRQYATSTHAPSTWSGSNTIEAT